ncbi:hypothetical protein [Thermococcus sp.]|uniref:hypothetical protein n=1 Tax=Thermococcus sp. TaxID=35749 RepID=UPI00263812CC|nr:hypothetical protein [Thermococcus sp.]
MVYLEHATTPVIFGALLVVYYFSIPSAFLLWYGSSHKYLRKRNFQLKKLVTYLLVAFFLTSLSAYKITSIYFYVHSPAEGELCLSSSCVLSSHLLQKYGVKPETLESVGLPSYGPMMVYRIYDLGTNATLGLPVRMNYVVIIRPLLLLPSAEVSVYYISGERAVRRKTFYVTWPYSPGDVITKALDVRFTVLIVGGGGGPGA